MFYVKTLLRKALPLLVVALGLLTSYGEAKAATWTWCANEGGDCRFSGTKTVRYGYGPENKFSHKTATNSIQCNNVAFGDPAPGRFKQCEYSQGIAFTNPLGSARTAGDVISRIVWGLTAIAIPIVSIMILWGAWQILVSEGNEEKYKKGKKTIAYAVIGLVILLTATGITAVITSVLSG